MKQQGGNTIVFDIETIPVSLESCSPQQQAYLCGGDADPTLVQKQMALWAPTNEIVAIGVLCVETQRGAVYVQSHTEAFDFVDEGIRYVSGTETDILTHFWRVIKRASRFVTFNGRQFDCPVLLLRSAMLGVLPTTQLLPYRYKADTHVDLLEQLTFYGATRKFSLDMLCRAFGIPSPKQEITGHDVLPLFLEGKSETIARYCAGDLWATRTLFLRWQTYLEFCGNRR